MYPILEPDRQCFYRTYICIAFFCFLGSWYWFNAGAFHFFEMFEDITAISNSIPLDFLRYSMPIYLLYAFATKFNREFRLEIFRFKWNLRYLCSKLGRRIPPLSAIGLGVAATLLTAGIIYGSFLK